MNYGNSWKSRSRAWATSCARPASQGASDGDRGRQAGFAPSFEAAGASAARNRSGATAISTPARSCCSSITERESRPPPSARDRFRHLGEREVAHAHGDAQLAAERVGERNVLVGELER